MDKTDSICLSFFSFLFREAIRKEYNLKGPQKLIARNSPIRLAEAEEP